MKLKVTKALMREAKKYLRKTLSAMTHLDKKTSAKFPPISFEDNKTSDITDIAHKELLISGMIKKSDGRFF